MSITGPLSHQSHDVLLLQVRKYITKCDLNLTFTMMSRLVSLSITGNILNDLGGGVRYIAKAQLTGDISSAVSRRNVRRSF